MGKIVNQAELIEILGKTQPTIWEWQKQGLPILLEGGSGKENQYDTEKVIAWWLARELQKIGTESAKDRLARLQADRVELELAEKRAQLVPTEKVEPAWVAMVLAARSYLLAERDRLAHLLEATPGLDAKRDLLAQTFDEFLRKLSAYDPGDDDDGRVAAGIGEPDAGADPASGGEVCAATEDDGGAVGGAVPVPVG